MKELAIRDLHSGDVVRLKAGVPVSGSRIWRVMELSDGSVYIDEKGYFEPSQIEGIHLAETQLLAKMGFVHDETQNCLNWGGRVRVYYDMAQGIDSVFAKNERGEWKNLQCFYKVEYLHELQQVFHLLCGMGFDIKLKR